MRLPSIDLASRRARATLTRFPFVLAAGVITASLLFVAFDRTSDVNLRRAGFTSALGIPLLFALAAFAERQRWPAARRILVGFACMAGLALFYLASTGWTETVHLTRIAQLAIAFHTLVAVLPFLGAGSLNGFWQYNRILFLRFLLATLYAGVLFGGLALALLALDNLFGIDVEGETYGRLWLLLTFVFHPWFFLAGLPDDFAALDTLQEYPNGLKLFTQFVLVPLVIVYLLILSAYLIRVMLTQSWPSGWIGWLVSGVAAAGTLALLLVHPLRERERWINTYGRWFYVALLPSIAMLVMAVIQRIGQYGITERRYFLLILALWLAGIALYYGITGSRNIRIIPATLCVLALVTLAGPWSAYAVSRASQSARFERLLVTNEMRVNGAVRPAPRQLSFEDAKEMSAILRYLSQTHGRAALAKIDPTLADTTGLAARMGGMRSDAALAQYTIERLGIRYVERWQTEQQDPFNFQARHSLTPLEIAGFDFMFRADLQGRVVLPVRGDSLAIQTLPNGEVRVDWKGQSYGAGSIATLVGRLREPLQRDSLNAPLPPQRVDQTPPEQLILETQAAELRIRIMFRELAGQFTQGRLNVHNIQADILVGIR